MVLDRGVAPDACLAGLREPGYRYFVVSRERRRPGEPEAAGAVRPQAQRIVPRRQVVSADPAEVRLGWSLSGAAWLARSASPPPAGGRPGTPCLSAPLPAALAQRALSAALGGDPQPGRVRQTII